MTRESREERISRQKAEHEEYLRGRREKYIPQLHAALFRVYKHGLVVNIIENGFYVSYSDGYQCDYFFQLDPVEDDFGYLDSLENRLDRLDEEAEERKRLELVRKNAINKLSEEERKVL